jgi:ABC-type transporter Mla subunit MlaD
MSMNYEETERTMQFILEQQAQITVKIDRMAERDDQIAVKVDRITEKVDKLADAQMKYEDRTGRLEESFLILVQLAQSTDERLDDVGRKMSDVSDKMNEVSDKMSEVGDKLNVLTDAQIHTDANIKNLVAVVDRYFSEGRNGMS